ncbi:MAG: hypothetical protein R2745_23660 [Vicinamibacterales bacterium]
MTEHLQQDEIQEIRKSLVRFSEQGWGLAFGSVSALGLFVATIWLVIRGGINVGEHLNLLGIYLPGYSVSYGGAVIGFVYAFVIGYGAGRTIATVYNKFLPH